jgi:2-(1,2-epoxy-1,2-dihydrophenyl)acetyl-CoA isomerase
MSEPASEPVGFDEKDGIVTLTMTGGVPVINPATAAALVDAIARAAKRAETRVVVLRSGGRAFCGGGDIGAIGQALDDPEKHLGPLIQKFHEVILGLRSLPVPVVGSVRGAAAGGGYSLALACDLLVASDDARFVAGYPALGTSPDGGLSHTLTARVGATKALELMYVNDTLFAPDALALGLVAQVVPAAELDAATQALAARLAAAAAPALREFKKLLGATRDADLPAQLDREKAAFLRCARTPEFRMGVEAFLARGARRKT